MLDPSLDGLTASANEFVQVIETLPENLFLARIDEWTPRDVTVHLAWWNRNMIAASESLRAGLTPAHYADAPEYRNINARAIAEFPSQDRRALLAQLHGTFDEFTRYLNALDAKDWDADFGVQHHRGGAATIRRVVEALRGDYEHHTNQVKEWSVRVGG